MAMIDEVAKQAESEFSRRAALLGGGESRAVAPEQKPALLQPKVENPLRSMNNSGDLGKAIAERAPTVNASQSAVPPRNVPLQPEGLRVGPPQSMGNPTNPNVARGILSAEGAAFQAGAPGAAAAPAAAPAASPIAAAAEGVGRVGLGQVAGSIGRAAVSLPGAAVIGGGQAATNLAGRVTAANPEYFASQNADPSGTSLAANIMLAGQGKPAAPTPPSSNPLVAGMQRLVGDNPIMDMAREFAAAKAGLVPQAAAATPTKIAPGTSTAGNGRGFINPEREALPTVAGAAAAPAAAAPATIAAQGAASVSAKSTSRGAAKAPGAAPAAPAGTGGAPAATGGSIEDAYGPVIIRGLVPYVGGVAVPKEIYENAASGNGRGQLDQYVANAQKAQLKDADKYQAKIDENLATVKEQNAGKIAESNIAAAASMSNAGTSAAASRYGSDKTAEAHKYAADKGVDKSGTDNWIIHEPKDPLSGAPAIKMNKKTGAVELAEPPKAVPAQDVALRQAQNALKAGASREHVNAIFSGYGYDTKLIK